MNLVFIRKLKVFTLHSKFSWSSDTALKKKPSAALTAITLSTQGQISLSPILLLKQSLHDSGGLNQILYLWLD